MKAGRTLRSLGEGGSGFGTPPKSSGLRVEEFRKMLRSMLQGASSIRDGGHAVPFQAGINRMKVVVSPIMRANPCVISLLTIGIFVFDMFTPVGVLISILYICPLLLTFLSSHERDRIYFSFIATALTRINFFLEPPGLSIP